MRAINTAHRQWAARLAGSGWVGSAGVQAQRHAVVHDGGGRETALALAVALVGIKQIANKR